MATSKEDKPPIDNSALSDSASDDSQGEEGWNDVEEDDDEEDTQEVISLLDDRVFPDVMSMLAHCRDEHKFDFLAIRQRLRLDFHGCVKLVNYIRQRVHEGLPVKEEDISTSTIENDAYLKPVLDDDAVILSLFDLPELTVAGPDTAVAGVSTGSNVTDLLKRNEELQEELARVTRQFENYRATVSKTLDDRWGSDEDLKSGAGPSASGGSAGKGKGTESGDAEDKEDESKYYWESYAGIEIHETMLKDTVRTDAYRDFIYDNKHLFKGKTVLDIGCGSGILSMFCAKAGAARVLAVDASAIITKARENIFHAGLSNTITTIHGKMEEVTLPVSQVDIIVSEWMGYGLLFEAMLPSVLFARDKYLAPQGLIVPSHTNMWVAPVSDPVWVADNGEAFWADVYGFDMRKAMAKGIYGDARVLHWPNDKLCGEASMFKMLNLYTTKTEDLSFTAPYASKLTQDVDAVDGFLIWFDTFFSPTRPSSTITVDGEVEGKGKEPSPNPHPVPDDAKAETWILDSKGVRDQDRVAFTTGPHGTDTHWKQALLLCDPSISQKEGEAKTQKSGDEIRGEITFSIAEDNARGLKIETTWDEGRTKQSWALK
ncbi:S-adenosyl-L-methionine-dependent methyltransferase [Xylariaceae sp. FL0255]|nr:S-adenosyl-L-methionine-dependent methyltransferase [Xylariaceae sp. FL0255]